MPLFTGAKLGPYEILSPIGAGGMGEVWKARDTRLDRTVAIKVSQGDFTERFEREARAIAALNHPNICQLYDVGPNYLVMEYIEGSKLAPPDSVRKLLDLALQIADGLSAAHALLIVHRDLKPENILVTRDGRAKILDFGLAKSAGSPSGNGATQTIGLTNPGTTVGTVEYMSPEQARGETNLTPQSDQFSFGLVLYELAAGTRAFHRGSAAETMTAIIRDEAEPLPGSLPAPFRWLIERLLAKEPSERYDSTRDLYRELKQIRERLSQASSAAPAASAVPAGTVKRRALIAGAGAIGCAGIGSALTVLLGPVQAPAPDLSGYKFTRLTRDDVESRSPVWAPDGKSFAYTARVHGIMQAFTQPVGDPNPVQITKADQDCEIAFWSRDGASIFYISGGSLWSIPAPGGAAQMMLQNVNAAALHPDGRTLAFHRARKLWIGSLDAHDAREFWPGPTNGSLSFSPDGSKLLTDSIGPLWLLPYPSGTPRKLSDNEIIVGPPSWFPDNRHAVLPVLLHNDPRSRLSVVDVTDGSWRSMLAAPGGFNSPSVSPDGKRIAFATSQFGWDVIEISIPSGTFRTLVSGGISYAPDWAPSGTHFIFSIPTGEGAGIEDRQAGAEGFSRRLGEARGDSPQWSPDGNRFVVYLESNATSKLILYNSGGGGSVLLDSTRAGSVRGMSWSPDGQWISYFRSISGNRAILKIRATSGATPEILAEAKPEPWEWQTRWSPAGDWIAYPAADGIDLISPAGTSVHKLTSRKFIVYNFSKDGRLLYGIFQNTTGTGAQWQLYSVDVRTGAEKFLAPIELPPSAARIAGFSIHPDGKRFLTSIGRFPFAIWMLEGFDQGQPRNWLARLLHR